MDRLLEAVDAGHGVDEAVLALHRALQEAGDSVGLFGDNRAEQQRPLNGSGFGSVRRAVIVMFCPEESCDRIWTPGADNTVPPVCEDHGTALQWRRV
ncbi:hypothetical protein [Streptomyces sp. WG-D5]